MLFTTALKVLVYIEGTYIILCIKLINLIEKPYIHELDI